VRRLVLAASPDAPEAQWVSVAVTTSPEGAEATLHITGADGRTIEKRVKLGDDATLQLARNGDAAVVRWDEMAVAELPGTGALSHVGLEVDGPPVSLQDLTVFGPEVRDYVFGVAPTDWWVSAGTWEVAPRWACDRRWSWYAGWGSGDLAIWNKRPVEGDVAMEYHVGVKMEAPGGPETARCRDLNAVLCGDKSDPRSGYSFILGGDGGGKTQLLRNGVVVAEAPDIRVPAGYGVHHEWFHVRVARIGARVEMHFEGRPVLRYDDPDPLPGGYVGIWSKDNGILVPRVTIYR